MTLASFGNFAKKPMEVALSLRVKVHFRFLDNDSTKLFAELPERLKNANNYRTLNAEPQFFAWHCEPRFMILNA